MPVEGGPGQACADSWKIAEYVRASCPSWPDGSGYGVATVVNEAHAYPDMFKAFNAWTLRHTLGDVYDLPIGTTVLCLPQRPDDCGWVNVLAVLDDDVVHCWLHPFCVKPAGSKEPLQVAVGLTRSRGTQTATHGDLDGCDAGVYELDEGLALVALWNDRGPTYTECSGHCLHVAEECILSSLRLRHILRFAMHCRDGRVVCKYGKHRSVSAAHVLQWRCKFQADWSKAARRRCGCESAVTAQGLIHIAMTQSKPPQRLALRYKLATRLRNMELS